MQLWAVVLEICLIGHTLGHVGSEPRTMRTPFQIRGNNPWLRQIEPQLRLGGGMMGGWGPNANPGRSVLTIGFWVLVVVGIGGIVIWAIRKPRLH